MALNTQDIQTVSASKPRGGARLGAGRPKRDIEKWLAARGISPATAAEILAHSDERRKWHKVLNSEDDRTVLSALMFLTQMRDGKPAQSINVTSQSVTITADSVARARAIAQEILNTSAEMPRTLSAQTNSESSQSSLHPIIGLSKPPLTLRGDDKAKECGSTNHSPAVRPAAEHAETMLLGDDGGNSGG